MLSTSASCSLPSQALSSFFLSLLFNCSSPAPFSSPLLCHFFFFFFCVRQRSLPLLEKNPRMETERQTATRREESRSSTQEYLPAHTHSPRSLSLSGLLFSLFCQAEHRHAEAPRPWQPMPFVTLGAARLPGSKKKSEGLGRFLAFISHTSNSKLAEEWRRRNER